MKPEPAPKKGMRWAINEKCKDCIYDPLDKGNWRQQVQACTSVDCSLYPYRPVSSAKNDPNEVF
jgi:hypothetical protein